MMKQSVLPDTQKNVRFFFVLYTAAKFILKITLKVRSCAGVEYRLVDLVT